ncbi:MAG: PilT/PilU family type 4a pilus ATPase [Gracilibacteraceae bacterium]|jgi:twitching motility protein PilT|nr:PilT/PilU family type 4a pilus ATPase [Gracilibacteraceae bacterium]
MESIQATLLEALALNASDLHLVPGMPPVLRVSGLLQPMKGAPPLTAADTAVVARELLNRHQWEQLELKGEMDASVSSVGHFRCRLNVFRQRNSYSLSFRLLDQNIKSFDSLGLPEIIKEMCVMARGLILITGPTGTGKTTTIASMLHYMNQVRNSHIVTLEDPIEYTYQHGNCLINQREITQDTETYASGLRAALRQDPDVIMVGEMRDLDSISIALTAAETGHLVLSTLHTIGAAKSIDRIIDVFPYQQQQQVRIQLSMVLQGIVSQQLIPGREPGARHLASEVLVANNAVRNLIRNNKIHQVIQVIETSRDLKMHTMDSSIAALYQAGKISYEDALIYCVDPDSLQKLFAGKAY